MAAASTYQVALIHIYVRRSIGTCLCCVYSCLISNQSTSKTHFICVKTSEDLTSFSINHTVRYFWYSGTRSREAEVDNYKEANPPPPPPPPPHKNFRFWRRMSSQILKGWHPTSLNRKRCMERQILKNYG